MILAILNLCVTVMPPIKFWLNLTYGLGYRNRMILAILNLCVTVTSSFGSIWLDVTVKFWLNPTYSLGEDVIWRILRWLLWWPSWIRECSDLIWLTVWDIRTEWFKQFWICVSVMPPIKFWLNLTYGLGDVIWRISRWQPSWISEWNDFSNFESLNFESLSHCDASHQVSAQSDLRVLEEMSFEEFQDGRHGAAIWDIGMEQF